jgi:microsomal dipeptidase-like Zn-dependent dipeptidase
MRRRMSASYRDVKKILGENTLRVIREVTDK